MNGAAEHAAKFAAAARAQVALATLTAVEVRALLGERLATKSKSVRKLFRGIDDDKSGRLSRVEFRDLLTELNYPMKPAEFDKVNVWREDRSRTERCGRALLTMCRSSGMVDLEASIEWWSVRTETTLSPTIHLDRSVEQRRAVESHSPPCFNDRASAARDCTRRGCSAPQRTQAREREHDADLILHTVRKC